MSTLKRVSLCVALLLFVAAGVSSAAVNAGSITYEPGKVGGGAGKHIVFVCGEWEYRCEESLPMIAKILATRHGFKCTVLFSMDMKGGTVNPAIKTNIPDMKLLKTADMMVVFAMDLELPDEQMKHFVDFVDSGKPVFGIRCTLLSFKYHKNKKSPYAARFDCRNKGGYTVPLFGESWKGHYGHHARESTRGLRAGLQDRNPLLRGVFDVWGTTDVYRITQVPDDATILMYGQVLVGMKPTDPPNLKKAVMPMVWTRESKGKEGAKPRRVVMSTIGAAQDMESEDLRRLYVNCIYWAVGLEAKIPPKADVNYVGGAWKGSKFGGGTYKKGLKPADFAIKKKVSKAPARKSTKLARAASPPAKTKRTAQ